MPKTLPLEDPSLPCDSEVQWAGAYFASFAPQWQRLLGDCNASSTDGDGVMLEWDPHPPLTRTPISFSTRDMPQDLQMVVDKLLSKGAIKPVSIQELTVSSAVSSWCRRRQGICVLSQISPA